MLCCCAELLVCFGGIAVIILGLVVGKIPLGTMAVGRGPAVIVGVLLLLPVILGAGGEVVYGFTIGIKEAQKGPGNQPNIQKMQQELLVPVLIIHGVGGGLPMIAALIVFAASIRKDKPKKRRLFDDDFDRREDDEPPRRSRGYDDRFRRDL